MNNVRNARFSPSRLYNWICCAVLFVVSAAASFNGFYGKYHFREYGLDAYPVTEVNKMLDGTADRPFVYRQMLPQIARACFINGFGLKAGTYS